MGPNGNNFLIKMIYELSTLEQIVYETNKIIFSCQRLESTYFPATARPKKTCFLATDEEK